MKHKILLLTFILLFGFQTFAQLKPFRFGVKAAPNIAWISPDTEDYENDGSVLGFSWGFVADITLMEHYFLKTGFNLDYLNGKLILPFEKIIEEINDSIPISGSLHRKYNLRYLEIPLTFKMRTNQFGKFAIYGNIGFGAAFKIRARSEDELYNESGGLVASEDKDIADDLTLLRGSVIVGLGTEIFLDKSTSIFVDVTYNNGLSNMLKDNENTIGVDKAFVHFFQLNIGVMF